MPNNIIDKLTNKQIVEVFKGVSERTRLDLLTEYFRIGAEKSPITSGCSSWGVPEVQCTADGMDIRYVQNAPPIGGNKQKKKD